MNSEYRDWKEKSKDQLKDNDFRECLRAHLQYLALSLEFLAIQDKEPQKILPKLDAYMKMVMMLQIPDRGPGRDLMDRGLAQSVFVQNLDLSQEIGKLKNWEQVPRNVRGMEEATFLPLLRQHAKEQLLPYWDQKIQRETVAAQSEALASKAEDFRLNRLPKLQWSRAEDQLLIGQGEAAYKAMFGIIKNNPAHPDFPKWASTLQTYLEASLPPAPVPAPASATATPPPTETPAGS
jgi:hypothetical protein